MAHIHGNKSGVTELSPSAGAGSAKMMDPAMGKMGMAAMENASQGMREGMGSMMKMCEDMMAGMGPMMAMGEGMTRGMGPMMGMGEGTMRGVGQMMGTGEGMMRGMGQMMGTGEGMMRGMGHAMNPGMTKAIASGVVVSAGSSAGSSVIKKVITHPLTLLGIGVVLGYLAHKYRHAIIATADEEE